MSYEVKLSNIFGVIVTETAIEASRGLNALDNWNKSCPEFVYPKSIMW